MKIGFMQGRLSQIDRNSKQSLPFNNWEDEFKIAKLNNYKLIEWTIDTYLIDKNPIFTKDGVKKIKELTNEFSVKIDSITCDFFMENPFFKSENNSIDAHDYLLKLLVTSYDLDFKYLILPLVDNSSVNGQKQKNLVIEKLNEISKHIPHNVKILFETDFNPEDNLKFIENFDTLKFGINYDTGNSANLGYNLSDELNSYYHYIDNIHIKDRKRNLDSVDLGKGDFDFKAFFKILIKKKYKGNLILQTARSDNNQHNSLLNQNRLYIEKFII